MNLSEIKQILGERGIRLSKSLGQNFLHDNNQIRRIISAAELTKADCALEVGPGLGPLTEQLVGKAGEVLAIEKDQRLVEILRQRFAAADNLRVLHDDALDFLRGTSKDWNDWKLVANLPYSVGSAILVELAQASRCPARMVVTVQSEVAQRLIADAGSGDYGVLSLLVQVRYEPGRWFKIPPACFFPAPDVDSACITFMRRSEPLVSANELELFTKIVKQAFSQRRKMMFKLLKAVWPIDALTGAFQELHLSPGVRAEAVSLKEFVGLAKWIQKHE